jgi:hypothetical protein
MSSLQERCGDQTAAGIIASVHPEYDVTMAVKPWISLPSQLLVTIRFAYRGGGMTCYPAIVPPPGSTRPFVFEQVGVVMDIQFFTDGGAFAETFEAEIKGRDGGGTFFYDTTPDRLQGTYRPDLPGYEGAGVGFWGNVGGDQTNGGVDEWGFPPGKVSELIPVGYWTTLK